MTLVGSEKVGILRSTRLLLGATGISAGTGGWGIIFDPPSPAAAVDAAERAPVAILPGLSSFFAVVSDPHASTIDRLANNTKTATPRATALMRLPPMFLLCNPFLFGHSSPGVSHVVADFGLRALDRRPLLASLCILNSLEAKTLFRRSLRCGGRKSWCLTSLTVLMATS